MRVKFWFRNRNRSLNLGWHRSAPAVFHLIKSSVGSPKEAFCGLAVKRPRCHSETDGDRRILAIICKTRGNPGSKPASAVRLCFRKYHCEFISAVTRDRVDAA